MNLFDTPDHDRTEELTGIPATPTSDAVPPGYIVTDGQTTSSAGAGSRWDRLSGRARKLVAGGALAAIVLGSGGMGFMAAEAMGGGPDAPRPPAQMQAGAQQGDQMPGGQMPGRGGRGARAQMPGGQMPGQMPGGQMPAQMPGGQMPGGTPGQQQSGGQQPAGQQPQANGGQTPAGQGQGATQNQNPAPAGQTGQQPAAGDTGQNAG